MKGDVGIRDSLKKNVSQRGLGSHRPHGTRAGLKCILVQKVGFVKYKSGLLHGHKMKMSLRVCRVTAQSVSRTESQHSRQAVSNKSFPLKCSVLTAV